MKNTNKVFLGGTCNGTSWRDELISCIQVPYFNPVVEDWTPECIAIEDIEKSEKCNVHLYVITSDMVGVYSIAEVIDSAHTKGKVTILHIVPDGFGRGQLKSLEATATRVRSLGGIAYTDEDLSRTARTLNGRFKVTSNDTY